MHPLRLKQLIHPPLIQYLIPYNLPADLAGKRLIMIVNTMRGLNFVGFALHPVLKALEVDALDTACASANTKQRVAS